MIKCVMALPLRGFRLCDYRSRSHGEETRLCYSRKISVGTNTFVVARPRFPHLKRWNQLSTRVYSAKRPCIKQIVSEWVWSTTHAAVEGNELQREYAYASAQSGEWSDAVNDIEYGLQNSSCHARCRA